MKTIFHPALILVLYMLITFSISVSNKSSAKAENPPIIVTENDSIQKAINQASPGETLYLKKGTYIQYQILINKSLTIMGEDASQTIISGNNQEEATVIFNVLANDVTIKNLTFIQTNPKEGRAVHLKNVKNVTIQDCNVYVCAYGIEIENSSNNRILRNNITQTLCAIRFVNGGKLNLIIYNNIYNNTYGILFAGLYDINNRIYSNNFIKNINNVDGYAAPSNLWNSTYILGGNYWSDYTGQDKHSGLYQNQTGSDGIGDTSYEELDDYPYMEKIRYFKALKSNDIEYYVIASTNSSKISNFTFKIEEKTISFTVSQPPSLAYCRVTMPSKLLYAENHEWTIMANSEKTNYTAVSDLDFTSLYFTYPSETNQISIKGTIVIPELQLNFTLILTAASITMLVVIGKSELKSK